MANYKEYSSDRLCFYGEFYCLYGSLEFTELYQCGSIAGYIYFIGDLRQSTLQQHFSTRSYHKVRLDNLIYILNNLYIFFHLFVLLHTISYNESKVCITRDSSLTIFSMTAAINISRLELEENCRQI